MLNLISIASMTGMLVKKCLVSINDMILFGRLLLRIRMELFVEFILYLEI